MAQKQAQFDGLADGINRVFMGDIRNFYYDDFPSAQATNSAQTERDLAQALGDAV